MQVGSEKKSYLKNDSKQSSLNIRYFVGMASFAVGAANAKLIKHISKYCMEGLIWRLIYLGFKYVII